MLTVYENDRNTNYGVFDFKKVISEEWKSTFLTKNVGITKIQIFLLLFYINAHYCIVE